MSDEPQAQRERLLDGWDEASKGWGRQADRLHASAVAISEAMLAHAAPRPGERVLELACGPGDTGFMAARLIAPDGLLIATDATAGMLEIARERAREQGVMNVEFKQTQLEWIDIEAASVDVVLCRWAVMLTLDPAAALRECRRVLKPGGRLALAVWDLPEANPWTTVVQRALVELGHVEPPAPGGPGMFALSAPGLLGRMLADAGFFDVTVEAVAITRSYADVTDLFGETLDLSRTFAGVWSALDDAGRRELREQIGAAVAEFSEPDGSLTLPGSSLVGAATA